MIPRSRLDDSLSTFRKGVDGILDDFEKEISFTEVLVWNDSIKEVDMSIKNQDIPASIPTKFYQQKIEYLEGGDESSIVGAVCWTEAKYESIIGIGEESRNSVRRSLKITARQKINSKDIFYSI